MRPEQQAAFADGLQRGLLPAGITAHADAARRFDVYRNNVAHSLTRALAARFPAIERLIGAGAFATLARSFIASDPPASPILHQWGAAFPDILAAHPALARFPYLADVARIEWARGLAYHAADATPVAPALLAQADPATARLGLHPSLSLIASPYPATSIWAAQQPGAAPQTAALTARGAETCAVLRDAALQVQVWRLDPGDGAMLAALARGATLLTAAEAGASAAPAHDPSALLLRLAAAGAITRIGDAP